MSTLRKASYLLLLLAFVGIAIVFAYSNPDPISVDVGFVRFDDVSMALAFAFAFGFGWLFGLATVGIAWLKMAGERRRLKKELRFAEHELSTLRSLPMHDAN